MIKKCFTVLCLWMFFLIVFASCKGDPASPPTGNVPSAESFVPYEGVTYTLALKEGKPKLPEMLDPEVERYVPTNLRETVIFDLVVNEDGQCMLVYSSDVTIAHEGAELDVQAMHFAYYPATEMMLEGNELHATFGQGYGRFVYTGADVEEYLRMERAQLEETYSSLELDEEMQKEYERLLRELENDQELYEIAPVAHDPLYLDLYALLKDDQQEAIPLEYIYRSVSDDRLQICAKSDEAGRILEFEAGDESYYYTYSEDGSYTVKFYFVPTVGEGPFLTEINHFTSDHKLKKSFSYRPEGDLEFETDYFYENGMLLSSMSVSADGDDIKEKRYDEEGYVSWESRTWNNGAYYNETTYGIWDKVAKVEISEEYGVRMTLEYVMNRSVLDRVTVQTPDGYKEIFDMNDINQCQSATLYDEKGVAVYVSEYVYENYDGGDPILKKIVFKDQDGNDIEKEYRFEYDSIDSYRATYKVYDEIGNPVSEDLVGNEYYRGSHRWFYIRTHGE